MSSPFTEDDNIPENTPSTQQCVYLITELIQQQILAQLQNYSGLSDDGEQLKQFEEILLNKLRDNLPEANYTGSAEFSLEMLQYGPTFYSVFEQGILKIITDQEEQAKNAMHEITKTYIGLNTGKTNTNIDI